MSDPAPPRALSPLGLPSAALHNHPHAELHPDSEAAVHYEQQRFSQELGPVRRERVTTLNEPRATLSLTSLRSRNALLRSSTDGSRDYPGNHTSNVSGASAQVDVYQQGRGRGGVDRTKRWYDAITQFWTTHISLSIEEGAHRDHLGTSPFHSSLTQSDS